MAEKRGLRRLVIDGASHDGGQLVIYTGSTTARAWEGLGDLDLPEVASLTTLVKAAYTQGRKDGARDVFERLAGDLAAAEKAIAHEKPGRPKTKRSASSKIKGKAARKKSKVKSPRSSGKIFKRKI